jgi:hypothetical protein
MVCWMRQLGHCEIGIKLLLLTQMTTFLEGIGYSNLIFNSPAGSLVIQLLHLIDEFISIFLHGPHKFVFFLC